MRGALAHTSLALLVTACATPPPPDGPVDPVAEPLASFLTDDLLQVTLSYTGDPASETLKSLTDCAAVEAILLRGPGYARHVRTTVSEEAGISRADAVYTVSPTLPRGDFVIDADDTAAACRDLETEGA